MDAKRIAQALLTLIFVALAATIALVVAVRLYSVQATTGQNHDSNAAGETGEQLTRSAADTGGIPDPPPAVSAGDDPLVADPLRLDLGRYGADRPYPSNFAPRDQAAGSDATDELERSSPVWRGIGTYRGAQPPTSTPEGE